MVIAIIGILATVSIIALNNARAKSRDAKRVADIRNIQTALALYYNDKKEYPITLTVGQPLYSTSLDGSGNVVTSTYISNIPSAPTPADGANCNTTNNTLTYSTSSDLQSYTLSTCVSNSPQNSSNAIYISDPVQSQPCGNYVIDYVGQKYSTVQIGTQCWMKSNLNVGTMVTSQASAPCLQYYSTWWSCQIDPNTIEKYCYSNTASYCVSGGGLYEWPEAMGFPYQCVNADFSSGSSNCGTATTYTITTKHRGICPSGWHIPTDSEQNTLDQYLTDAGGTCNASRSNAWDCATAGTKLKVNGSSGFNGILAGYRYFDGSFYFRTSLAAFWSSSVSSANTAWNRTLHTSYATVFRYPDGRAGGFSLRCLKD